MPFTKVLRQNFPTNLGFELLSKVSVDNGTFSLCLDSSFQDELQSYQRLRENLLYIPFSTVDHYLSYLETLSQLIDRIYHSEEQDLRGNVLYYLAAAVSDFYLLPNKLFEHKIQSGSGLVLSLDPVPKLLPLLTSTWASCSYVVSFKLETDRNLVIEKATRAIQNYGVHSVIANQLQVSHSSLILS
jgi:phosphopantothenate---cysteine ligase (ATP)